MLLKHSKDETIEPPFSFFFLTNKKTIKNIAIQPNHVIRNELVLFFIKTPFATSYFSVGTFLGELLATLPLYLCQTHTVCRDGM